MMDIFEISYLTPHFITVNEYYGKKKGVILWDFSLGHFLDHHIGDHPIGDHIIDPGGGGMEHIKKENLKQD